MNVEKAKTFILYLYIFPFFCWTFDVFITFYVIDVLRVAGEINPLGWPLGALGALIFYVPALIFTHILLFRIKNRLSLFVAILVTVLALMLGIMNLLAGLHNIGVIEIYTGRVRTTGGLVIGLTELFNNIVFQILFLIVFFGLMIIGIKEIIAQIGTRL